MKRSCVFVTERHFKHMWLTPCMKGMGSLPASPLLLAVTMHGVLRKQIAWVFTSFMLSEEGSGRRW